MCLSAVTTHHTDRTPGSLSNYWNQNQDSKKAFNLHFLGQLCLVLLSRSKHGVNTDQAEAAASHVSLSGETNSHNMTKCFPSHLTPHAEAASSLTCSWTVRRIQSPFRKSHTHRTSMETLHRYCRPSVDPRPPTCCPQAAAELQTCNIAFFNLLAAAEADFPCSRRGNLHLSD